VLFIRHREHDREHSARVARPPRDFEHPRYTEEEKVHIAEKHLIAEQAQAHGLKPEQFKLTNETIHRLVNGYTREAGVRNLKAEIASVARSVATDVATGACTERHRARRRSRKDPGPRKVLLDVAERTAKNGRGRGPRLDAGGRGHPVHRSHPHEGQSGLLLTGQLGDVMKESARRPKAGFAPTSGALGIRTRPSPSTTTISRSQRRHPQGWSLGGGEMLTALNLAVTGRPMDPKVAMTGEITLRGAVLRWGVSRKRSWRPVVPASPR